MAQSTPDPGKIAKGACPICSHPTEHEFRPFCSRRCANIDLYKWLSGGYAIAGAADADEDGDDGAARDARAAGRKDEDEDEEKPG